MAFTLVHTADWQMGMRAQQVGAAAESVRAARMQAAERVIDVVNSVGADALVLAGDTFEDNNVPRELVQRVVDILRKSRARVFVLPANHDPLVPRGVFDHPAWNDAAPHVTVMRSAGPFSVGEADFFACPLNARRGNADPLESLPEYVGPRSRIRVGVAHGSVRDAGVLDEHVADNFPIDLRHVERASLDYLALGHWHIPSEHPVDGKLRAAYSGSHEPTKFGEVSVDGKRGSGQCLVVRIDGPGAVPRIEVRRTAVLEWQQRVVSIRSGEDLRALRASLDGESAESAKRKLLDLSLVGSVSSSEKAQIAELESLAKTRFLFARVRSHALLLQPGDDGWLKTLPLGAPQAAAQKLLQQAQGEGRDAEVARTALLRLFELSEEYRA